MGELGQLSHGFDGINQLLNEARIQVKEAGGENLRRQLERVEATPNGWHGWTRNWATCINSPANTKCRPGICASIWRICEGRRQTASNRVPRKSPNCRPSWKASNRNTTSWAGRLVRPPCRRCQETSSTHSRTHPRTRHAAGPIPGELSADPNPSPSPYGNDRIEFLVSANPGLPPRPLGKVASGGELSRISLSVQVAATDAKTTPILVFDEVDSGIGGGVAEVVGQKLRTLGKDTASSSVHPLASSGRPGIIICWWRKPAARPVRKTQVRRLSPDQRKHEIARMLGGVEVTDITLAHASELLYPEGYFLRGAVDADFGPKMIRAGG